MQKKLALLLAVLFMAVSVQTVRANDDEADAAAQQMAFQADDEDDADADVHPLSLGHPGHWIGFRGHGPARMPGMQGRIGGFGQAPGQRAFGIFGTRMMREIDLTDSQKSQFIDAMTEAYRARLVLHMEQDDAYQKLKKEYEGGNPNRDVILALNTKLGELKGRADLISHDYFDKVKNIVTPDQQAKIKQFMEDASKRMEERRAGRGPGMMGPGGMRGGPRTLRGPGPRMQ